MTQDHWLDVLSIFRGDVIIEGRKGGVMDEHLKELRWKQRFENYSNALKHLSKGVEKETLSDLEAAGLIQYFEVSFELAWKVMKDYLQAEGFQVRTPRESIKEAYRIGLIERGELWLEALQARNLSAHTYDEKILESFIEEIRNDYFVILRDLKNTLESKR